MARPARGDYVCRYCGAVLHSPGALGGHVAQHTRLGRGNPSNDPTIGQERGRDGGERD